MGAVKEKIYELAELVYQIIDSHGTSLESYQEVDEYIESQVSTDDYEFYQANKDTIFDTLPYLTKHWEKEPDGFGGLYPDLVRKDDDDEFDEDKMREDMYDPQDDPVNRNLMTGEMDESYIMPTLEEGCNCGGKRPRPVLSTIRRPVTPIKRPPTWTIKRPKRRYESVDEIEMPALNEVDYNWMTRNNRERDNSPRFAYGQRSYVDPKKTEKQIAPEYDYNERKSALGHITRKHEILKDMGYDLDDEIEMPEIAPTKKEIKTLSPRNKQFPENKFNQLKSEYNREEILMDRLFKKHNSPKFESEGTLDEIARRGFGDDYGDHVMVKKACADQELERYGDDDPDEDDEKDSYKNRFNKIADITK